MAGSVSRGGSLGVEFDSLGAEETGVKKKFGLTGLGLRVEYIVPSRITEMQLYKILKNDDGSLALGPLHADECLNGSCAFYDQIPGICMQAKCFFSEKLDEKKRA